MRLKILNIQDVAESQMCCGCGACAYVRPESIKMVDVLDHGRRPAIMSAVADSAEALAVCPGIELEHTFDQTDPELIGELAPGWGPVYKLWEGHAGDDEIRFRGSSGGAATALALYCVERGGMHGVLHVGARADVPYLNRTVYSRSRDELLSNAGSRYAPASPCDGLQRIVDAPGPSVFIGKPCDVAGAGKARRFRPELDEKLGATIAFFCAGTPSTKGTFEMLAKMGVKDPSSLISLRYRGNGWPGMATAVFRQGEETRTEELTYDASWGKILQRHRQWRCYVCPDHTGEFADIAVGDPWYRKIVPGESGSSLILARTPRGRQIIEGAIAAGYLKAEAVGPEILVRSQPNLLRTRGAIWGRIWTCKLFGAATPVYRRIPMKRFWWSVLSVREKLQSFFGTAKRVFRKRLTERVTIEPFEPPAAQAVVSNTTPAREPAEAM